MPQSFSLMAVSRHARLMPPFEGSDNGTEVLFGWQGAVDVYDEMYVIGHDACLPHLCHGVAFVDFRKFVAYDFLS